MILLRLVFKLCRVGPQQPSEIILPYCGGKTLLKSPCDVHGSIKKFVAVVLALIVAIILGLLSAKDRSLHLSGADLPCLGWFPHTQVWIVTQQNTPRRPFEALGPAPPGCSPLSRCGLPGSPAPFLQLRGEQEASPGFLVPALQSTGSRGSPRKQSQGSPRLFPRLRDRCPILPEN